MAEGGEQRTARQVQQSFAESLGYGTEIIWDLLSEEQSSVLKTKIEQLIPDHEVAESAIIKALEDTECLAALAEVNFAVLSKEFGQSMHEKLIKTKKVIDKLLGAKEVNLENRKELEVAGFTVEQSFALFGKIKETINQLADLRLQIAQLIRNQGRNRDEIRKLLEWSGLPEKQRSALLEKIVQLKRSLADIPYADLIREIAEDDIRLILHETECKLFLTPEKCAQLESELLSLIENHNKNEKSIRKALDGSGLPRKQIDNLKKKFEQLKSDQERGQNAIHRARQTFFESVWTQRKYTNRNSLSSIIYVLVSKETDFNRVEAVTEFSIHPVLRSRKCTAKSENTSNSNDCCMIFVDEVGRVYQNWNAYVKDNVLPEGTMIAPHNGIYNLNSFDQVMLDKYTTPAGSVTSKVLGVVDTTTAVGGFLSACVPVAALLTLPVSAPIMGAAAIVGLGAAGYSTVRSGAQLVDRSQHEQSINITDRQARNSWLGVAAGFVGLGAAGATTAVTATAAAGREVGMVAQCAVNGMNITSIMLSGSGVANGVLDLYLKHQDGEVVTTLDKLQLAASLVLFTHSVSNFRLASTIINETQKTTIAQMRRNLSNRQRRAFDKMSKETIRIRGETRGKMDIIRGTNEMPSKQQFNDLFKINKQLNEHGVRPSFAPNGEGVLLNNEVIVNTQELRANLQHNSGPNVIGQVTQPIPESFNASTGGVRGAQSIHSHTTQTLFVLPNGVHSNETGVTNWAAGVRLLSISGIIIDGVLIALSEFGTCLFNHIVNAENFEQIIHGMAHIFPSEAFRLVMNMARTFIDTLADELHNVLKFYISTETILYRMVKHIIENYKDYTFQFLEAHTLEIFKAVEAYFRSLNPNNERNKREKCSVCSGYFAITEL